MQNRTLSPPGLLWCRSFQDSNSLLSLICILMQPLDCLTLLLHYHIDLIVGGESLGKSLSQGWLIQELSFVPVSVGNFLISVIQAWKKLLMLKIFLLTSFLRRLSAVAKLAVVFVKILTHIHTQKHTNRTLTNYSSKIMIKQMQICFQIFILFSLYQLYRMLTIIKSD